MYDSIARTVVVKLLEDFTIHFVTQKNITLSIS